MDKKARFIIIFSKILLYHPVAHAVGIGSLIFNILWFGKPGVDTRHVSFNSDLVIVVTPVLFDSNWRDPLSSSDPIRSDPFSKSKDWGAWEGCYSDSSLDYIHVCCVHQKLGARCLDHDNAAYINPTAIRTRERSGGSARRLTTDEHYRAVVVEILNWS